jgi:hypothetical protein
MKHLLLLLFLTLTQLLSAQSDTLPDYRRLQLGVVGGIMEHEVDFTPNARVDPIRGNQYGVALRYFDKQLVGFQAELTYVEAGWQEKVTEEDLIYERRTTYAELQLLTQFSVGRGAVQPMLQAGPYLSVPLSEEEDLPAGFTPTERDYYGRELDFRLNYGLRAGLGLNIELGGLTLQLEGRYLQGFSNLIKPGQSQASTSVRTGYGGQIGLFYAIN